MERLTRLPSGSSGLSTPLAVGTGWGCRVGACTLLGPEGPGAHRLVCDGPLGLFWSLRVVVAGGGSRPYFENYTVDASILKSSPFGVGSKTIDDSFWNRLM